MKTITIIFAIYGLLTLAYQIYYIIRKHKKINKLRSELIKNADSLMD